jgi:hypothetical protein
MMDPPRPHQNDATRDVRSVARQGEYLRHADLL